MFRPHPPWQEWNPSIGTFAFSHGPARPVRDDILDKSRTDIVEPSLYQAIMKCQSYSCCMQVEMKQVCGVNMVLMYYSQCNPRPHSPRDMWDNGRGLVGISIDMFPQGVGDLLQLYFRLHLFPKNARLGGKCPPV